MIFFILLSTYKLFQIDTYKILKKYEWIQTSAKSLDEVSMTSLSFSAKSTVETWSCSEGPSSGENTQVGVPQAADGCS
jgi:hypothetical protein